MPSLLSKNSLTAMARIPSCAKRSPKMIWVWLLFGNELPPLHRLKEALLVLINMEGPVLLERSEEHTSELQSRLHLVCRLLLEKKKKTTYRLQKALQQILTVIDSISMY